MENLEGLTLSLFLIQVVLLNCCIAKFIVELVIEELGKLRGTINWTLDVLKNAAKKKAQT